MVGVGAPHRSSGVGSASPLSFRSVDRAEESAEVTKRCGGSLPSGGGASKEAEKNGGEPVLLAIGAGTVGSGGGGVGRRRTVGFSMTSGGVVEADVCAGCEVVARRRARWFGGGGGGGV